MAVLGPAGPASTISAAPGPITEITASSALRSVERDVAADLVHLEVAHDGGGGDLLGADPEPVGEPQDPHVALHVALAVEQRRVAALALAERLDVVGQLALEILGGLGAADVEHAPLGAPQQPGALAQRPVLPVELDRRSRSPSARF